MSNVGADFSINPNGTLNILWKGRQTLFIPTDGLTGYNQHNNTGYGNFSLLVNPDSCTLSTCDLSLAAIDYIPSLAGNAFFCAIFGFFLFINVFFAIRYKTWGYGVSMFFGLLGEVVGYASRIALNKSPFDPTGNEFIIYIVCLTIAPAFLSAGIYLCLGRIVVVFGESISRFRPRTYTLIFCFCDFFSLVLQGAGGGIASTANSYHVEQGGINTMLAGLSFQVVSLFIFATMSLEYAFRLYKNPMSWDTAYTALYNTTRFKSFLWGLSVATLTLFIRSVYRVAELSQGFNGSLANNQAGFMVLEGAMVTVAAGCMTFLHPGIAFRGRWSDANFHFRKGKGDTEKRNSGDIEGDGVATSSTTTPNGIDMS